ncbi:MAG: hypothetical protein N2747_06880 [Chitinophagaceae bacterium]|nr:hypothetical protein [Chitinophagaceae bacterium]
MFEREDNRSVTFRIVVVRKNHFLFSFLRLRVIVNAKDIYPLADAKPVMISLDTNPSSIVVTDGYHFTKPYNILLQDNQPHLFQVVCAVTDRHMLILFVLFSLSYFSGLFTGFLLFKVFSFLPLLYLVGFYYLNRSEFIRLVPVM